MRLDPEEDREPIASLVRDGFQTPHIYSVRDAAERILLKMKDHGKWPQYMTGSYAQCRRWEADIALAAPTLAPQFRSVLTIMNVRVIERPGPVTLIWSEGLT